MFFGRSESTFTVEFVYFLHLSLDIYVLAVWFLSFLFNMKYGYSIDQIMNATTSAWAFRNLSLHEKIASFSLSPKSNMFAP